MKKVVQFLHPGPEYEGKDWHPADKSHGRRFIFTKGRVKNSRGQWEWLPVTAWVEWEANAKLYPNRTVGTAMPKNIHLPYLPNKGIPGPKERHSTDPCVFGDRFLYTVCRQINRKGNPTKMQSLEEGSVILFGSRIKYPDGYHFVLDTLFVVSEDRVHHSRESQLKPPEVPDWYFKLTLEQVYALPHRYTLLKGYTPEEQPEFFSWIPCKVCNDSAPVPFERPKIKLRGIRPKMTQGFSLRIAMEPKEAWDEVVRQVKEQGCELCAGLEVPTNQPNPHFENLMEKFLSGK
ncbi:MAG: hypothetical protein ABIM74_02700 [candidate division WOR-3 bacterium]